MLRLRGGGSPGALLGGLSAPKLPKLESLKVPIAFLGWYLMSIVYSVLNKQVLEVWRFPFTFSAVQLLVGGLWICMLWSCTASFFSLRSIASWQGKHR